MATQWSVQADDTAIKTDLERRYDLIIQRDATVPTRSQIFTVFPFKKRISLRKIPNFMSNFMSNVHRLVMVF